ncbi:MAG TPA: hypothetical protein DD401_08245 [Prevotella sp.]|nr:hypothetical protein [Prevotella sp.]
MKKIFTLLFFVFATLSAMAQEKTITVTQPMTTSDNVSESPLARDDQTVVLTKNEDGTWDLTMKDLAAPSFLIGDITFKDVTVEDPGYHVCYITSNGAVGKVESKSSKYYGAELVLQINGTAELSDNGAGAQTIDFSLFNYSDEDFEVKGLFAPKSEQEPDMVAQTYYVGTSGETTCPGMAELYLYLDQETSDVVKLGIGGLADVNTEIGYGTIYVEGVKTTVTEDPDAGTMTINITNDNSTAATEDGDPITVKSFDIDIIPNYGTGGYDLDDGGDDFGGDDFGGDDPGLDNEFIVKGSIVIADPTTGADVKYELSSDESLITAIKGVKGGNATVPEVYSVDGMKLEQMHKGLNIVRLNGKTIKVVK